MVDSVLEGDAPFTSEQVVDALRAGRAAHDFIPDIMPVRLFTLYLPVIDPANAAEYLREADRALRVFRLNHAWYAWVERRSPPALDDLDFYDRMRQTFADRPSAGGS